MLQDGTSHGHSRAPWVQPHSTLQADVCILGGGIAGLTTAYLLAREGRKTVVLDTGPRSDIEHHAWDILSDWPAGGYRALTAMHGHQGARLAAASRRAALQRVARIVKDENLQCQFTHLPGYLYQDSQGRPLRNTCQLEQEFEACRKAGLWDSVWWLRLPETARQDGRALRLGNQARLLTAPYQLGLVQAIARMGGTVLQDSYLQEFYAGPQHRMRLSTGPLVEATALVVATPTGVDGLFQLPETSYTRSYGMTLKLESQPGLETALFLSDSDKRALIDWQDGQYLLQIEENRKDGTAPYLLPQERYQRLEAWARQQFRGVGDVMHRFSRPIAETVDRLPWIGRYQQSLPGTIFLATGQASHSTTMGTVAALLLRDLVMARPSPWESLYDPHRCPNSTIVETETRCQGQVLEHTERFYRCGLDAVSRYTS